MTTAGLASILAAALPDAPRWVEVRGMLLSGHAEVSGGASVETGFVVKVLHGAVSSIAVVGCPPAATIESATGGVTAMTPVLAQIDNAKHVDRSLNAAPGARWTAERAIVHRLTNEVRLAAAARDLEVRLLTRDDRLEHLPPGLCHEITHARVLGPVAVVLVDGAAGSFCYPVWTTETLWDVSIDTLEAYRGRSLAPRAVGFMIAYMRRQGREPVWGALESNTASLRLAAKLGFRPEAEIVAFSRGPWAFLSAGFTRRSERSSEQ